MSRREGGKWPFLLALLPIGLCWVHFRVLPSARWASSPCSTIRSSIRHASSRRRRCSSRLVPRSASLGWSFPLILSQARRSLYSPVCSVSVCPVASRLRPPSRVSKCLGEWMNNLLIKCNLLLPSCLSSFVVPRLIGCCFFSVMQLILREERLAWVYK